MDALEFELKLKVTATEVHIIGAGGTVHKYPRDKLPEELYKITYAILKEQTRLLESVAQSIKQEIL